MDAQDNQEEQRPVVSRGPEIDIGSLELLAHLEDAVDAASRLSRLLDEAISMVTTGSGQDAEVTVGSRAADAFASLVDAGEKMLPGLEIAVLASTGGGEAPELSLIFPVSADETPTISSDALERDQLWDPILGLMKDPERLPLWVAMPQSLRNLLEVDGCAYVSPIQGGLRARASRAPRHYPYDLLGLLVAYRGGPLADEPDRHKHTVRSLARILDGPLILRHYLEQVLEARSEAK